MRENGRGGAPPETIHIETDRQKELREMKERAGRVIEASYGLLCERYEEPSEETVDLALRDMLTRDVDKMPLFLKPYHGWEATEVPEDVFEEVRELLKMPFHKKEHSQEVVARTVLILEEMQNGGVEISPEEFELGRMIAAAHDLVQKWRTVQHDNGKLERERFKEQNERESADELIGILKQQGFDHFDEQVLRDAFEATIPGWDPKNGTVKQEALTVDSHPVVRAIALADLGAAGMNTESYVKGGDQLFVEENLDMLNLDVKSLDEDQKTGYMKRMLAWSESQIGFARGRKARFEEELGSLPEPAKEQLRKLFSQFDASIERSERIYQRRRGLKFEEVYSSMGF